MPKSVRRCVSACRWWLASPPYYYSNSQEELEAHYHTVRATVDRPLFLYHIPQNVKVKVDPPVVRRLAADGVIVGLKDSQNDLQWLRRVAYNAKADGVDLRCFLGTQAMVDVAIKVGGIGAIPGAANVAADASVRSYDAARRGDLEAAARHAERVMLTYPSVVLPFATWLMMGYYRSIPEELEDAAMIDGCNRFQAFYRVILPLTRPALLAVAMFAVTQAWNEFLYAYMFLTKDEVLTLPVGLNSIIAGDVQPWGELMAASLLTAFPVVIIYMLGQRFMVAGLTGGSVKG
jgi:hypothetical protein